MTTKTRGKTRDADAATDSETTSTPEPQGSNGFAFDASTIQKADSVPPGVKSATMAGANPFTESVREAANQGIHKLPVQNGSHAVMAERFLRSAANNAGYGVQIRFTDTDGNQGISRADVESVTENLVVWFTVSTEKFSRPRSYTADDVRTWAKENGYEVPDGQRIPKEVRSAYRRAHDLPVR